MAPLESTTQVPNPSSVRDMPSGKSQVALSRLSIPANRVAWFAARDGLWIFRSSSPKGGGWTNNHGHLYNRSDHIAVAIGHGVRKRGFQTRLEKGGVVVPLMRRWMMRIRVDHGFEPVESPTHPIPASSTKISGEVKVLNGPFHKRCILLGDKFNGTPIPIHLRANAIRQYWVRGQHDVPQVQRLEYTFTSKPGALNPTKVCRCIANTKECLSPWGPRRLPSAKILG